MIPVGSFLDCLVPACLLMLLAVFELFRMATYSRSFTPIATYLAMGCFASSTITILDNRVMFSKVLNGSDLA
jgi:hypothetical protein